ncbi:MAG: peptidylprolyl isomerase [Vicinamibacterales bacterium]
MGIHVNGEPVSDADVRAETTALHARAERLGTKLTPQDCIALRDQALATLIERVLLFQEARRLELAPTAGEIEAVADTLVPRADGMAGCRPALDPAIVRAEAARRLVFGRVVAHWTHLVGRPSAGEVGDYYRKHSAEFDMPETVHVSHIARNHEPTLRDGAPETNQRLLESLRLRVLAGEEFAALAVAYSDCPEQAGDLGYFPRGVMVEEFDAVVFRAEPGVMTSPFKTCFAWHVALVHEHRAAHRMALKDAAPRIEDALHRAAMNREAERQLDALRAKAVIAS